MKSLYTDISIECCAWLGSRVEDGSLPPGDVLLADVRGLDESHVAGYSHVHLFAGIGGMALGAAWAGWPADITLLTGGFPCQDVSAAGRGAGLGTREKPTARSGLFWELVRVLGIFEPEVCLLENVGALSRRGLDLVARTLGEAGYIVPDAYRVGAWAVGAPHERERWWIVGYRAPAGRAVAHTRGAGQRAGGVRETGSVAHGSGAVDDAESDRREGRGLHARPGRSDEAPGDAARPSAGRSARTQPDAASLRRGPGSGVPGDEEGAGGGRGEPDAGGRGWGRPVTGPWRTERGERIYDGPPTLVYAGGAGRGQCNIASEPGLAGFTPRRPDPTIDRGWTVPVLPGYQQREWEQPRLYYGHKDARHDPRGMGCAVHGLPGRVVDSLNRCGVMACGNAVVPQVVAAVARGVLSALGGPR